MRAYFAEHKKSCWRSTTAGKKSYQDWQKKNAEQAKLLDDAIEKKVPADLLSQDSEFP